MEDASTSNVATMVKGFPPFDTKDIRVYKARVEVRLSISAPDMYDILTGRE